ncbi:MAG: DoxX family protein [Cyanobacteria bacterium P01_A01_bin.83]
MKDTKIQANTKKEPRWKRVVVGILTIIVSIIFLAAGSAKLFGTDKAISMFDGIGFGQWFRYLTGSVEILGAILLLLQRTSFWGALLLSLIMISAVLVHLFFLVGSPSIALALLITTSTLTLIKPISN